MKDITVVTTFHQEGLDLYGQRFLDSFAERVDKQIKLIAYAENCNPQNRDPNQITVLSAEEHLTKLQAFKEKWRDVPKANGKCPFPEKRPRDYHKKFKWDAVRFANKVYAVFDAFERSKDWCVWMDADTFVHSYWPYEDWDKLLPNDSWITFVGRGKGSQTWPECGFYGMNKNNLMCKKFIREFEFMYENADSGIFTLEEWHDSFIFGHILNKMIRKSPNVLDYSSEMYLREAKTGGGGHPLINGPLGKYMDHMKGGRKEKGKSAKKDIVVFRTEGYWQ